MKLPALAVLPILSCCLLVGCADGSEAGEDRSGAAGTAAPVEDHRVSNGDEALELLLAGNERYRSGKPQHDHESLRRRARLTEGQHPFAIVLGCADSRVPPELIFDHGLGDLFVIRVAGNVVAEDEAGSIEYALAHLDVPLVLVLGHEGCGAVTAALGLIEREPEELVRLLQRVQPALADVDRSLPIEQQVAQGVEANVMQSVRQLERIAKDPHIDDLDIRIAGAVYNLHTGEVEVIKR